MSTTAISCHWPALPSLRERSLTGAAIRAEQKERVMAQMISRNCIDTGMNTQLAPAVRPGGNVLRTAIARALVSLRRAWTRHCDERQLQELSDYQLRDIGIRRGQIHGAARDGRY